MSKPFKRTVVVCALGTILLGAGTFGDFVLAKPTLRVIKEDIWIKGVDEYLIDVIAKEFEVENNCKVEIELVTPRDEEKKALIAIEVGTPYDIVYMDPGRSGEFIFVDALMELDSLLNEIGKKYNGWTESSMLVSTIEGKHFGIPHVAEADAMYNRKDILDAAGLAIPDTWGELLQVALKVSDPQKGFYGYGGGLGNADGGRDVRAVWQSLGGKLVEEDGRTIALDSPETLRMIRYYKTLWEDKCIPPDAPSWTVASNNKAYLAGEAAIVKNTGSIAWQMQTSYPDLLPVSVITKVPSGPGGRANPGCMILAWHICKAAKYPELAKKFIKKTYEEEHLKKFHESGLPQFQPVLNAQEDWEILKDPINKGFLENVPYMRQIGWPGPPTVSATIVAHKFILSDMISRVLLWGYTPREALDEAMERTKEIYARY